MWLAMRIRVYLRVLVVEPNCNRQVEEQRPLQQERTEGFTNNRGRGLNTGIGLTKRYRRSSNQSKYLRLSLRQHSMF